MIRSGMLVARVEPGPILQTLHCMSILHPAHPSQQPSHNHTRWVHPAQPRPCHRQWGIPHERHPLRAGSESQGRLCFWALWIISYARPYIQEWERELFCLEHKDKDSQAKWGYTGMHSKPKNKKNPQKRILMKQRWET